MAKVVGFDETRKKRVTCGSCAAIIEYHDGEIQRYSGRDYSGGPDGCIWVVCPNCGKDAVIRSW